MIKDSAQIVQAMPLLEGKVSLDVGTHKVSQLIHCVADGTVTVKWDTGATAPIAMLGGQDFAFKGSITIVDGTYHIA